METKKGYVDSFVAYIDILGFKEYIIKSECEKVLELFDDIEKTFDILLKDYGGTFTQQMLDTVTVNIISDSIILSVPKATDRSLEILLQIINILVFSILCKYDLLCRGAIAEGDFYSNDNIAFGPAFVEAYMLESKTAVYPRIIFTHQVFDSYKAICDGSQQKIDSLLSMINFCSEDALFVADYIETCLFALIRNVNDEDLKNNAKDPIFTQRNISACTFDKIKKNIELKLSTITDLHVREKYLYFRKYYNNAILVAKKYEILTFKCDFIFGVECEKELGEYQYNKIMEKDLLAKLY